MFSAQKKRKGKTSKFVVARSNNSNEREGNYQHGMDRKARMVKNNKSLDTERRENIYTLQLNYI